MFLALLQEETTGIADAAGDAVKQPVSIFTSLRDFAEGAYLYVAFSDSLSATSSPRCSSSSSGFCYRLLTHGLPRVLRWRRRRQGGAPRRGGRGPHQTPGHRDHPYPQRLRYVVFVIVALVILSIFIENPLPGVAGATIIAAVIGFGAQSFLRDVIAGFSIVFEGQYSVGDFVLIKPQDVSGVVEELGLRMTKIRSLSGEVSYVPNGTMQGVVNYISGSSAST